MHENHAISLCQHTIWPVFLAHMMHYVSLDITCDNLYMHIHPRENFPFYFYALLHRSIFEVLAN